MTEFEIRSVLADILRALSHLAYNRLAYRKLNPQSISLYITGMKLKSKLKDPGLWSDLQTSTIDIRTGFPPPELLSEQAVDDSKLDVWGAGMIFFKMLCRADGSECMAWDQSAQFIDVDSDALRRHSERFPPAARNLVRSMLEKDPAKRPSANQCQRHEYFQ
mmetsp:Transcript_21955/g.54254  ORF Transcript_21955/g.54254 Transcript_21955/m.54254 type:complete len:162 (-) Transcript_21955:180-665(-)